MIGDIKQKLQDCGVVGAGGAGFPSYAKLADGAEFLILNCAECEPLLSLHRGLLAAEPLKIISALAEIGEALGVKKCIIGIKSAYKAALEAIEPIAAQFDTVEIKTLPEVYPAGDEVVLVYQTTGRVVPAGGLPIEVGAIVYNVETVYNAYRALHENAPVTDKLVTVAAEVRNPATVRVPLGTPVSALVAHCGGATVEDPVLVSGGPMMGKIVSGSDVVTKTTNAILVLPSDHLVVRSKRRNPQTDAHRAASACCHCHMCSNLCPRRLLGYPIDPSRFMNAIAHRNRRIAEVYLNAQYCSGCGLCEAYACMQGLSPRVLLDFTKKELKLGGVKPMKKVPAPVLDARVARFVPVERLTARLGLGRYATEAPLDGELTVPSVRVPLSMHIGAPATAAVRVGDTVRKGDLIGRPDNGLSVAIHAPIDGRVTFVGKEIIIEQ